MQRIPVRVPATEVQTLVEVVQRLLTGPVIGLLIAHKAFQLRGQKLADRGAPLRRQHPRTAQQLRVQRLGTSNPTGTVAGFDPAAARHFEDAQADGADTERGTGSVRPARRPRLGRDLRRRPVLGNMGPEREQERHGAP